MPLVNITNRNKTSKIITLIVEQNLEFLTGNEIVVHVYISPLCSNFTDREVRQKLVKIKRVLPLILLVPEIIKHLVCINFLFIYLSDK